MYTLYHAPASANKLAQLTPLECDTPYRLGQQRSAAYPALNPNGVVPILTEWA